MALRWDGRRPQILDQALLPPREEWLTLRGAQDTAAATGCDRVAANGDVANKVGT